MYSKIKNKLKREELLHRYRVTKAKQDREAKKQRRKLERENPALKEVHPRH